MAAALQIKIWQIVDTSESGGTFSLLSVDHDSAAVYLAMADMDAFLGTNTGPAANLSAVTGSGQDYVIPSVPDGGSTLVMVGMALLSVVGLRRKLA